jgi:hypothetical protein
MTAKVTFHVTMKMAQKHVSPVGLVLKQIARDIAYLKIVNKVITIAPKQEKNSV